MNDSYNEPLKGARGREHNMISPSSSLPKVDQEIVDAIIVLASRDHDDEIVDTLSELKKTNPLAHQVISSALFWIGPLKSEMNFNLLKQTDPVAAAYCAKSRLKSNDGITRSFSKTLVNYIVDNPEINEPQKDQKRIYDVGARLANTSPDAKNHQNLLAAFDKIEATDAVLIRTFFETYHDYFL